MNDVRQQLFARVASDLENIEAALRENLNPYLDLVSETAGHLLFSGGKRFRPLLMVLSSRLCGYGGEDVTTFSTVFEYLHTATLLHDDLVDGAALRRGKPVAHSIYGNATAVLVGDFLLARSLSIGTATGRMKVIEVLAHITENMSQGEIHQMIRKGQLELTEAEYLTVIRNKTAVLIEGACRVGAIIADAPQAAQTALSTYGYNVGMAFQMADDLLDYTSDSDVLGKQVGADLREGKLTLPVIRALQEATAADRTAMAAIIQNPDFSIQEFKILVNFLEKYGGIAYTRRRAGDHIEKAKSALAPFDPSQPLDILLKIAEYALAREH